MGFLLIIQKVWGFNVQNFKNLGTVLFFEEFAVLEKNEGFVWESGRCRKLQTVSYP